MLKKNEENSEYSIAETLRSMISFHDDFSEMLFGRSRTRVKYFEEHAIYMSIAETLKSIDDIVQKGRMNDAYALIRKYCDIVVTHIYLILHMQEHQNQSSKKHKYETVGEWMENDPEGFEKEMKQIIQAVFEGRTEDTGYIDLDVQKWIDHHSLENREWKSTRKMIKYIEKSGYYQEISKVLPKTIYINLRQQCNNHLHYNTFRVIWENVPQRFLHDIDWLTKECKIIEAYLIDIFTLHFMMIILLDASYFSCIQEYADYLELGMTPPDELLYEVPPFISEAYYGLIDPRYHDLLDILKDNTTLRWDE